MLQCHLKCNIGFKYPICHTQNKNLIKKIYIYVYKFNNAKMTPYFHREPMKFPWHVVLFINCKH